MSTERSLTKEEYAKLAEHGCEYPWSPWKILALIERFENDLDVKCRQKTQEEIEARIKKALDKIDECNGFHNLKLVRTNVWECTKCSYATDKPSIPGHLYR